MLAVGKLDAYLIIKALFPVLSDQYWYFTAYFCVFFFMPLFNILLSNLNLLQIKYCFVLIFLFCSILPLFCTRMNPGGYTVCWICLCYILGGCLRLGNLFHWLKGMQGVILYCGIISFAWIYKIFDFPLSNELISYTSPFILTAALIVVLCFMRIKFSYKMKKVISSPLSRSSFSAYLIHANPLCFAVLCSILQRVNFDQISDFVFVIITIIMAVTIYMGCILCDQVRIFIFRKCKIHQICDKISNRIICIGRKMMKRVE